jgi:uncharacterized protein
VDPRSTGHGRPGRLTILVGETDRHGHQSLYTEIVSRARRAGLAGATVLRGPERFGATAHLHRTPAFALSEDLPVVIIIADEPSGSKRSCPSSRNSSPNEGPAMRKGLEVLVYRGEKRGCSPRGGR